MHTQIADAAQSLDMRPLTDAEMDAVNGGILPILIAGVFGFGAGMITAFAIVNHSRGGSIFPRFNY